MLLEGEEERGMETKRTRKMRNIKRLANLLSLDA
jgi:hypothetical protein